MLAPDFSPFPFSTCGLSERERLPIWREQFRRALLRVDIEPKEGPTFFMRQWSSGHCLNCALSRALGQLNALGANRALAADGDDSISIVIGEGCTASQRGHYVTVDTGDGVAVRAMREIG